MNSDSTAVTADPVGAPSFPTAMMVGPDSQGGGLDLKEGRREEKGAWIWIQSAARFFSPIFMLAPASGG